MNELTRLHGLASRIESTNAYKKFRWGKTKKERPEIIFDKDTGCKPLTNATHNSWWAYFQPSDRPRVIGYGKTLEEALKSVHAQLQLGPQQSIANHGAQTQRNGIANGIQSQVSGVTTTPGARVFTLAQILNAGPGSHMLPPAAPASLQIQGLGSVSQPTISAGTNQIFQPPQKSASQNNSQKDNKTTFNSLHAPATYHTMQMPSSGLSGDLTAGNPPLDQLMEGLKSLQQGLDTMSSTFRMTDFQSHLKSSIPPSTSPSSVPSNSFGKPPAPPLNKTGSRYKQSNPTFSSLFSELKRQNVRDHYQNKTNVPEVYQSPRSGSSGYHSLPSPAFSFSNRLPSIPSISATSSTSTQTGTPPYTSHSMTANALAISQRTRETDPSLFQLSSELSNAPASDMAGVSTEPVQNRHVKRKHDCIDDGVTGSLRMNVEQRVLKTPKTEEWFQTIKNEENSPKKIKTEELDWQL